MNKLFFLGLLFTPFYLLGQSEKYSIDIVGELNYVVVTNHFNNTKDTIYGFLNGSSIYSFKIDEEKGELAIIQKLDEWDILSYWYHLFKFNDPKSHWESASFRGINSFQRGYKKPKIPYIKYSLENTRTLIRTYEDNKVQFRMILNKNLMYEFQNLSKD